jgi:hypothetical protein
MTIADGAADQIFDGPNDLVVDEASMTRLVGSEIPIDQVKDFSTNSVVHHCNYFAQAETADFLSQKLLAKRK